MKIHLASPRGFCAGVDYAIDIVERALRKEGKPVYVRHEIVHNRQVVDRLTRMGAVFVEETSAIPEGETVIYSAHGVSPQVRSESRSRRLDEIDATCPLVRKVHDESRRLAADGYEILLIGHRGHVEVEGTFGEAPDRTILIETVEDAARVQVRNPDRVAYLTQTTLSVDDTAEIVAKLRERFPRIAGPAKDDICYATQNRQNAVKELCKVVDCVLVVGDPHSSNSNRLVDVARRCGRPAWLVQNAAQVDVRLGEARTELGRVPDAVGLTAGASAPADLIDAVLARLHAVGGTMAGEIVTARERIHFALPASLRDV
ncbi:MAG: 4-hydroxy-3-methylbut-2-enyl diphosphate reductase 2 [Planctomycetes bacterium]|nr:4-hydroxy-3-methylbut-2-enyl diphosphate reductase 2 [Planctomycetota bacterium]